jgi:cobalt-precorrin 5A hydrolase
VVCVDDAGRFAVSLLSGHLGGADVLAWEVADVLGGTPVITSASHVKNTLAVDLLGRGHGWRLEADSTTITRVSAAVVNGEPVAVLQETGEQDWISDDVALPANLRFCASPQELAAADCVAALIISDRENPLAAAAAAPGFKTPMVVYRPRSLVVGMGCRRGVSTDHLEEILAGAFRRHNLSLESIKCIATADIKRDEPGLLELAGKYGVPVVCYGAAELNAVFEANVDNAPPAETVEGETSAAVAPTRSQAAHRLLGVWGVSEPAALLASGASQLLVSREKTDRATIAVARIPFGTSE